jgi:hypothetical protein
MGKHNKENPQPETLILCVMCVSRVAVRGDELCVHCGHFADDHNED